MDDPNRMRMKSSEFYYKSPEVMEKTFSYMPEAIANVCEIAESCHVELDMGHHFIFRSILLCRRARAWIPELRAWRKRGWKNDWRSIPSGTRLTRKPTGSACNTSLALSGKWVFRDIFLIVREFINWARIMAFLSALGAVRLPAPGCGLGPRDHERDPLPYNLRSSAS